MVLRDRIATQSGNFFEEPLLKADTISRGNNFHDWGIKNKKKLIKETYDSLPYGEVFMVI